jgi:ABC-type transporter Mla maintaining outer membrane lipid asymmetry ATPase subunit MlaF
VVVGLDPLGRTRLSSLLDRISSPEKLVVSTPVVLGLRPQDSVPSWSTHLVYVEDNKVISLGEKRRVVKQMKSLGRSINLEGEESSSEGGILEKAWTGISLRKGTIMVNQIKLAEPLVEMKNVKIEYYNNLILSDFSWTIRRGEKWGLFGPNG